MTWQETAKVKREAVLALIPEEWRIKGPIPSADEQPDVTGEYLELLLTPRELEITNTDPVDIFKQTSSGQWTAYEVTKAFCHRAAIAHQLVNCLHEIFFEQALADAERLDRHLSETKRPLGPLHGLPVSLKDQFHVKGVETSMGYVGWIGTFQGIKGDPRYLQFESVLVRELRELGAVLHCKTSVPATLMSGETANNIVGYTENPKNRRLAAGGSSGGEGALIAMRGSVGGFGTDIGGSVRIPSAFNGLCGLRPSTGRLPYGGAANSMDGQNSILSVVGPLAPSAGALKLLFQSVVGTHPWLDDPMVMPIPWRDHIEAETLALIKKSQAGRGQLAFGIYFDDGRVRPQPPVARALRIVAASLERLGHKIIRWEPPSHDTAGKIASTIYNYDGDEDVKAAFDLSGETPPAVLGGLLHHVDVPAPQKIASEIAMTNRAKRAYQEAYLAYWNSTAALTGTGRPVDGFFGAVAPYSAARPLCYDYTLPTVAINVIDYTSIVIPVTQSSKQLDPANQSYTPLSPKDKEVQDLYDADLYDGTPVNVQLVGRRYEEEKLLVLADYLGKQFRLTQNQMPGETGS